MKLLNEILGTKYPIIQGGKLARGDIGHAALYNGIFCT